MVNLFLVHLRKTNCQSVEWHWLPPMAITLSLCFTYSQVKNKIVGVISWRWRTSQWNCWTQPLSLVDSGLRLYCFWYQVLRSLVEWEENGTIFILHTLVPSSLLWVYLPVLLRFSEGHKRPYDLNNFSAHVASKNLHYLFVFGNRLRKLVLCFWQKYVWRSNFLFFCFNANKFF